MNAHDLSWLWGVALSRFASALGRCAVQYSNPKRNHIALSSVPNAPTYRSHVPEIDVHPSRPRPALILPLVFASARQAVQDAVKELTRRNNASLGTVLLDFSKAAQKEIEKRRKQLIAPIDEQEAYVLDQLRDGYTDLLRGSTAIKAHLASVVKVNEQRERVLQKLGAVDAQKRLVNTAVELSADVFRSNRVGNSRWHDVLRLFRKGNADARSVGRFVLSALRGYAQ